MKKSYTETPTLYRGKRGTTLSVLLTYEMKKEHDDVNHEREALRRWTIAIRYEDDGIRSSSLKVISLTWHFSMLEIAIMDLGSLIAFSALCILILSGILLLIDCLTTATTQKEEESFIITGTSKRESDTLNDPTDSSTKSSKVVEEDSLTCLDNPTTSKGTSADNSETGWRCACEGGFLPPGLLQNFSGAEAVLRMSAGRCYHKKGV